MDLSNTKYNISIANDAICVIVGVCATSIKGVHSLKGNITSTSIAKTSPARLSDSISLKTNDNNVSIHIELNVKDGYNINEISKKVQEKVKEQIESMTNFTVESVSINISDIKVDK